MCEIFGGLRNIPGVENYSVALTNFHGGTLHVKFSGGVKTFSFFKEG